MNPKVQELLESTHCPKHGMEWEACCYAELTLQLHNKVADLITTVRKEARAAAFKEAIKAVPECSGKFLTAGSFREGVIEAIEAAANDEEGAGENDRRGTL